MNVLSVFVVWVVIIILGTFIGGLMLQYSIEFWIGYARKTEVDIAYWQCCLLGVFAGWNIALVAWIVTAIAKSIIM